MPETRKHQIVIGGAAGLTVTTRLLRADRSLDAAVVDPNVFGLGDASRLPTSKIAGYPVEKPEAPGKDTDTERS